MSNKERIVEIEGILRGKIKHASTALSLREELGLLKAAEVEAPKEPTPVKIVKKVRKPRKS